MSATARSPFALPEHKMGKGGMRFEPDRFCGRGAAVPGGVHFPDRFVLQSAGQRSAGRL